MKRSEALSSPRIRFWGPAGKRHPEADYLLRGNLAPRNARRSARVAEYAQRQRETQLVAGTPPSPDVLQVFVAQGVVAPFEAAAAQGCRKVSGWCIP